MLKLVTVNGHRVDRPPLARPIASFPIAPILLLSPVPVPIVSAAFSALEFWCRCAALLAPPMAGAFVREASTMTAAITSPASQPAASEGIGTETVLHLLKALEVDLEAVNAAAGELDAIQAMALVFSCVGLISQGSCLRMVGLVNEHRASGKPADDLIDAVLQFRPADWGYCTWNDTLGGRGHCAHIYPPVIPRRDSEVPTVIGAFSELMATARAVVKAWLHVKGAQP